MTEQNKCECDVCNTFQKRSSEYREYFLKSPRFKRDTSKEKIAEDNYNWLRKTYKGYSVELLNQALNELNEFDAKDILEVPSKPIVMPIMHSKAPGVIQRVNIFTLKRQMPVYVIKRFLRRMVSIKNPNQ